MSNELMFSHLTIVVTGSCGRFRTLIIPMDGVQSNKLYPHFVQQLEPKDLLQEPPLLKCNLCVILSCNKRRLGYQMEQVIENEIKDGWTPTKRGHYTPSFVHKHVLLIIRVTHPIVPLNEKVPTLPVSI